MPYCIKCRQISVWDRAQNHTSVSFNHRYLLTIRVQCTNVHIYTNTSTVRYPFHNVWLEQVIHLIHLYIVRSLKLLVDTHAYYHHIKIIEHTYTNIHITTEGIKHCYGYIEYRTLTFVYHRACMYKHARYTDRS